MAQRFFLVDVFAERPYSGNQLAVVIGDEPLPEEEMQQFAAETNYSETTFLTARAETDGGYRVRIFTPAREIAWFTAPAPTMGPTWPHEQVASLLGVAAGTTSVPASSSKRTGRAKIQPAATVRPFSVPTCSSINSALHPASRCV